MLCVVIGFARGAQILKQYKVSFSWEQRERCGLPLRATRLGTPSFKRLTPLIFGADNIRQGCVMSAWRR